MTTCKWCFTIKISQHVLCKVNYTGARLQVALMHQVCSEGPDSGQAEQTDRTEKEQR